MKDLSQRERNRLEKHNRILDAALEVFSRAGYSGASMDAIAEAAHLTKPTLYQYFPGKDALFQAVLAARRDVMLLPFDDTPSGDLVAQLHAFAWAYAETVMSPAFLSLARLIIGEAQRLPRIGRAYQASGPDRVRKGLQDYMTAQRQRGRLRFDDAELAAEDFWGLILSAPRNRALHDPDHTFSKAELARYINNGLRVFLSAYSTRPDQDLTRLTRLTSAETPQND